MSKLYKQSSLYSRLLFYFYVQVILPLIIFFFNGFLCSHFRTISSRKEGFLSSLSQYIIFLFSTVTHFYVFLTLNFSSCYIPIKNRQELEWIHIIKSKLYTPFVFTLGDIRTCSRIYNWSYMVQSR